MRAFILHYMLLIAAPRKYPRSRWDPRVRLHTHIAMESEAGVAVRYKVYTEKNRKPKIKLVETVGVPKPCRPKPAVAKPTKKQPTKTQRVAYDSDDMAI